VLTDASSTSHSNGKPLISAILFMRFQAPLRHTSSIVIACRRNRITKGDDPSARNPNHPDLGVVGAQNDEHLRHPATPTGERRVMWLGVQALIEKPNDARAVQERQTVGHRMHASRCEELEVQSIDRSAEVPDPLFWRVERAQGLLELCDEQRRDSFVRDRSP
jgi:hypothetical protein